MVKIEFLPSDFDANRAKQSSISQVCSHQSADCIHDDNYTIIALAKSCAATQIQAIWRGNLNRKTKYESLSNRTIKQIELKSDDEKVSLAARAIQKGWRSFVTIKAKKKRFKKSYQEVRRESGCSLKSIEIKNVSSQTDLCLFDKNDSTQITGQERESSTVTTNELIHEAQTNGPSKGAMNSTRGEIINSAYESCRSRIQNVVNLNGFEIVNVLQAMSILQPREYEILLKTMLSHTNTNHNPRFKVRLTSSLQDFESDMNIAWKSLTQKASDLSPSSAIFLGNKCDHRFKLNSSSQVARSHLQELVELSDEFLSILELNDNIISYDDGTIQALLTSIGIPIDDRTKGTKWSLLEHLESELKQVESSFLQSRIESALSLVRSIVEWERSLGESNSCSSFDERQNLNQKMLEEKTLIISELKDEIEQLKQQISISLLDKSSSGRYCKPTVDNDFNTKPVKEKSALKRVGKENMSHNTTLSETKVKRSRAKQKRRQESVNRVEIKFNDLFEKQSSKSTRPPSSSQKNTMKKGTTFERKKSPKLHSYKTGPKSNPEPLSLAQTIAKSMEKRTQYCSNKFAWSEVASVQREETKQNKNHSSDQSTLFLKVPRRRNPKQDSNDGRFEGRNVKSDISLQHNQKDNIDEISADSRFNIILEKLRRTTAELEPRHRQKYPKS